MIQPKIKTMLDMQMELNNNTAGRDWLSGTADNGNEISWKRYIVLEVAEFMESFPYKHWKDLNKPADIENAKIEVVDIFHFMLSHTIESFGGVLAYQHIIDAHDSIEPSTMPTEGCLITAENLISAYLSSTSDTVRYQLFFKMMYGIGMSFDELYSLYIGKNVLNKFRQVNGYKEGTYVKIWDGEEDNVHMQKLLVTNIDIAPHELYSELTQLYNKII